MLIDLNEQEVHDLRMAITYRSMALARAKDRVPWVGTIARLGALLDKLEEETRDDA